MQSGDDSPLFIIINGRIPSNTYLTMHSKTGSKRWWLISNRQQQIYSKRLFAALIHKKIKNDANSYLFGTIKILISTRPRTKVRKSLCVCTGEILDKKKTGETTRSAHHPNGTITPNLVDRRKCKHQR